MASCKTRNRKVWFAIFIKFAVLLIIASTILIKKSTVTTEYIVKYQLQELTFDPRTEDILEDVTLVAEPTYQISQNTVVLDLKNQSDLTYLFYMGLVMIWK